LIDRKLHITPALKLCNSNPLQLETASTWRSKQWLLDFNTHTHRLLNKMAAQVLEWRQGNKSTN